MTLPNVHKTKDTTYSLRVNVERKQYLKTLAVLAGAGSVSKLLEMGVMLVEQELKNDGKL